VKAWNVKLIILPQSRRIRWEYYKLDIIANIDSQSKGKNAVISLIYDKNQITSLKNKQNKI